MRSWYRPQGGGRHPPNPYPPLHTALLLSERSSLHLTILFSDVPDRSESFPPEIDQMLSTDPSARCEQLVGLMRHFRLLFPSRCEQLEPEALKVVRWRLVNVDGTPDVWISSMDNHQVVIKSHSAIHADIKVVCSFFHFRFGHALTSAQTNILVDARGRIRVADLGIAFLAPGANADGSSAVLLPSYVTLNASG